MTNLFPFEDPLRRCLKVDKWPVLDQSMWYALFEPGDILDGTVGVSCNWSEETRDKYRKGYGRWLTYLITTEQLDGLVAPALRVTPERVSAYLAQLQTQVSDWTTWGRLAELLAVANAFCADTDWSWLRRFVRFLEANSQDSRNKYPRLRPATEIAAWAYTRMDELIINPPDRDPASKFRDALMIALLITCPAMRLGNLTMIRIGHHLMQTSEGFRLTFSRDETKTDKPMALPVPNSLSPYLDRYINHIRPQLIGDEEFDRLWITKYGQPMKGKTVYDRITKVTKRAFGVSISPHLFRDCAVTTVAIDDPEHIGIAAPILGHTDPRTTEKHYIQANSLVAGRRLRQSVDTLRRELSPPLSKVRRG